MSNKLVLTHAQEMTIVTALMLIGLSIAGYYAFLLAKLSREGPRPEQVAPAAERPAAKQAAAQRADVTPSGGTDGD